MARGGPLHKTGENEVGALAIQISTKGMTDCRNANAAALLESIMKLFYMCPLAQSGVERPVSYQKV